VEETTPFGPDVLVYKVGGKMFALATPEEFPHSVNLKCDPERAIDLRDRYEDIQPGYHMNKRHWNTLLLGGRLSSKLIVELIDHSYQLVVASLSRKVRAELSL
jgi:predicted DNA-binding protein (MmcQ/YjbR family)